MLTWPTVFARRLDRQAVTAPSKEATPADLAAAMCGAHAQVLSAAELSIGLRSAELTRADVRTALWTGHSLVKTFGPRGTVHLLAARDLPMWTGALSSVPSHNAFGKDVRLTDEQTDEIVAAAADALADAELTIDELSDAIVARTGPWAGDLVMPAFQGMWPRWRQALPTAGLRGVVCFGANRGRKVTYTNPHRWVPGFRPAETGPADLLRHYLRAYGPATPQDFAKWLAAPPRWAGDLFAALAGELEQVEVEGDTAWLVAGDTEFPAASPEGVRLLPYFDAFAVACQPRGRLFPGRAAERALAGSQAGNFPVLLIDGEVAGVWHQRRSGRRIDITVEPLAPLTSAQRRGLDEQAARVGHVLEAEPRLTVGPVTVGAHA